MTMSQTTKIYAIRNRHGAYYPRSKFCLSWSRELARANLFTKVADARAMRTRLTSCALGGDCVGEHLTIVELTLSNPRPVQDSE